MSYYGSNPPQNNGSYYGQQAPQPAPSYYGQQASQPAPSYSNQQNWNKPQQNGPSSSINEGKINQNPKYNDLWAAVLFILCMISFAVLAYFGINNFKDLNKQIQNSDQLSKITAEILGKSFAVSIATGFIASLAYFFLMQSFAGKMIWGTGILMILINIAFGIFFVSVGNIVGGIVMLVLTLIYAWFFYSWRHRIPFAKVMLKTVTRITGQFPATLFSGFIGLIFGLGFSFLFIFAAGGWGLKNNSNTSNNGATYAVYIYLLFCFYWSSEVVKNVVHVTVSGLFATVYFMGTADPSQKFKVTVPVQNPTIKSAKRALTTSFGSICYGSLIIALIQTLRAFVRGLADQARSDGNLFALFCLYCLDCILSIIESLVEYFNKYAFTQVAIYGKDFCTAGKDTWRLIKSRGVDAIINDSLIGNVLGFGMLFIGMLAGGLGLLAAWKLSENEAVLTGNAPTLIRVAAGVLGLIVGMAEFSILSEVITSGVATVFVCLAEDPYALQRTQPELFQKIAEVYPQVMTPA